MKVGAQGTQKSEKFSNTQLWPASHGFSAQPDRGVRVVLTLLSWLKGWIVVLNTSHPGVRV
jgi:hypothetical protein